MMALRMYFWGVWPPPAGTAPAAGSLLLLGVGRAWWLPWILIELMTGGYSGGSMEFAWYEILALICGAALLGVAIDEFYRGARRRRAWEKNAHRAPIKREGKPHITGWLEGLADKHQCSRCGDLANKGAQTSDDRFLCPQCMIVEF